MLNLVPFAGAWRKVADGKRQSGLIRKCLQLQFPESQPRTITAPAIGSDQKCVGSGIELSAFKAPPTTNRCNCKRSRVMVGANVHKSYVAPQVVDAIGKGPRHFGTREVVPLDRLGLFGRKPLLAGIRVVAHQFFLLGVYRYNRPSSPQSPLHAVVDMPKLGIPIRVILAFLQFAITLEAVVLLVEELSYSHIADRMILLAEFGSERPRAFADPPQGRFRIATGSAVNQAV